MEKNSGIDIDCQLGQLIKRERILQRVSQSELAYRIGISAQQVQKYEKGVNRISVGRLYQIGVALNVSPMAFIEEIATVHGLSFKTEPISLLSEEKELISSFRRIESRAKRTLVVQLLVFLDDTIMVSAQP